MTTKYYAELKAKSGAKITVILNSDSTWNCDSPAAFGGISTGHISSWGTGNAILQLDGPYFNITLNNFGLHTAINDHGEGTKTTNNRGKFPDGELYWTCIYIE
ncbi:MAG: hypothetical protein IPG66_11475 [Hydrogenophilales bacterium]|nr:hypothetical protein [Hydrogenophilales bacterium]